MRLLINDTTVDFPSFPWEVTLGQRAEFHDLYGRELEAAARQLAEITDPQEFEIAFMDLELDRMYARFAYFAGCTVDAVREMDHHEIVAMVDAHNLSTVFTLPEEMEHVRVFDWNGETWELPEPHLVHGSVMTFGEIIDAKQAVKDRLEGGMWAYLPHLCAIFLRRTSESYDEAFLHEGSKRLQQMHQLPLHIALQVAAWFEEFNEQLQAFPVFQPSRIKGSGKHSRRHFDRWGWVNFLKAVAKTKVFDIAGITSIESVRIARAFDVLVYASEDKELNEAQFLDYEAEKPKR